MDYFLTCNIMDLVSIATITGLIGDAILQITAPIFGGPTGWGLNMYFAQHGSYESLFIASGMMALFYIIYIYLGFSMEYKYLVIYGILLDLIFRQFQIFQSLSGYYKHLNYFWSAFWGAIPMVIPLFISSLIA